MWSLFLRILTFSVNIYEFSPILDLTVVFKQEAYLSDDVISSLLEGDLIHTDCCRAFIL